MKNPCGFEREFIPSKENPRLGHWTECPSIKEVGGDMDCERYKCEKCGYSYTLYYDEMR